MLAITQVSYCWPLHDHIAHTRNNKGCGLFHNRHPLCSFNACNTLKWLTSVILQRHVSSHIRVTVLEQELTYRRTRKQLYCKNCKVSESSICDPYTLVINKDSEKIMMPARYRTYVSQSCVLCNKSLEMQHLNSHVDSTECEVITINQIYNSEKQ